MNLMSWGMYPKIESRVFRFSTEQELKEILQKEKKMIPYGNGRSYGDSALSPNIIDVKPYNYFIDFDEKEGLLHLQAGALLSDILESFVPKGWFLKITAGTKFITVGGAIASDVHGKNHHIEGCFSESVKEFRIMLQNGKVVNCSKDKNIELFKSTCGGMGLTGIILEAKIYLKKIDSSSINQITIKNENLRETFDAFEKYKSSPYSVAWIDCLAEGLDIGKSILMVGDFSNDRSLNYRSKIKISIPFNLPSFTLNKFTVKAFNWLYYWRIKEKVTKSKVDIDTFFYPLDSIGNWNRIYGKEGFTQYQCIIPKERSYEGIEDILGTISDSGKGSCLAVIKLYGKRNSNYLSFPLEGYSLALDFKIEEGLFNLLKKLDNIVVRCGGRIYLTKDVTVSKTNFESGYPMLKKFKRYREKNKMPLKFESLQSKRLKI
jgi:FAD/FMN-containing dehydrogenase